MTPIQRNGARAFPAPAKWDPKSRATVRANWLRVLAAAQAIGARAGNEVFPDRDGLVDFTGLVVRFANQTFPLEHESAQRSAKGFREFAQAFCFAVMPELKVELGLAMAAAARCCARMLEMDVEAQAAVLRRRQGERGDD